MKKTIVVTARIDEETLALLDKVAAAQDRSRAWVIARAIEKQARADAAFVDFVQVGLDDLDAGRSITQEELVQRLRIRRQVRQAA